MLAIQGSGGACEGGRIADCGIDDDNPFTDRPYPSGD
jgi:hypothetical protein